MPYTEVMHKFKGGTLKSGSGHPVKSRAQAIAIMLDEKRKSKTNPEYRADDHRNDDWGPITYTEPHARMK